MYFSGIGESALYIGSATPESTDIVVTTRAYELIILQEANVYVTLPSGALYLNVPLVKLTEALVGVDSKHNAPCGCVGLPR